MTTADHCLVYRVAAKAAKGLRSNKDLTEDVETNDYSQVIEELILEHSRPAVYLSLTCPPPAPLDRKGTSKFGGRPNLPPDLEWPRGKDPYDKTNKELVDGKAQNVVVEYPNPNPNPSLVQRILGRRAKSKIRFETTKVWKTKQQPLSSRKSEPAPPLHFLAQINCSELPESQKQLPKMGALFFFARMDDEAVWDDDPLGICVLYSNSGLSGIPEREPPNDTWQINTRHLPALGAFGGYRGERIITNVADEQVFPEWPIELYPFTHIVDPQALYGDLPSSIDADEKFDFWQAFENVRTDRIKSTLPQDQPVGTPLTQTASSSPKERHQEWLAEQKRKRTPWRHLPELLTEQLCGLSVYITEVAAHVGAAAQKIPKDLDRQRRTELNAVAIDRAHLIVQEAHDWIERVSGLAPHDAVPDTMANDFVTWLEDIAKANYIYRVQKNENGEEQTTYMPLLRLDRSYGYALEEIARNSVIDGELHAKTPDALYAYCDFTNDFSADNHQMLGHFRSCQNAFDLTNDDVHLLRLNSTNILHWCFWDVGEATFFIKVDDLAANRFDRAWASIQG